MSVVRSSFQCPACKTELPASTGRCATCGHGYLTDDGILDFVVGRFDTQLDAASYDASHTIDDALVEADYQRFRYAAAHRWPVSLGSVVEIGCGTGGFSRAMIAHRAATDVVLTDVSLDMLRLCRGHLDRLGIGANLPVRFASYSANEACFRDASFDTCIGASVVHHIGDVRAFLADVWRILRPGGRACFMEPGVRYHRAMAMAFSDIIAGFLARDPAFSPERQVLHNWVAEARRGVMLQGDVALLGDFEDKHMFVGDAFEALARESGFAAAEALPSSPDPDGLGALGGLLARLRVDELFAAEVTRLWPAYADRYLALLNARDLSLGYLFWLTKSDRSCPVLPPQPVEPLYLSRTEEEVVGGGPPLRWTLTLTTRQLPEGLLIRIEGWCVAVPDIKSVRVTVDGVSREAPVWMPRADVHLALNAERGYPNWNSLCCGVGCDLRFGTERERLDVSIDLVLADHRCVPIVAGDTLRADVPFETGR